LTEFTSPYSLNTQRGWHTSKLRTKISVALPAAKFTFRRLKIFV